jgi:hypothetical protein
MHIFQRSMALQYSIIPRTSITSSLLEKLGVKEMEYYLLNEAT